ncbi:hypothetical protein [Sphingobacterium faecium]|uniref:hypothetical protein n=1 Tax=Sphingobacterium faecium TaxID=34087 RepID=UPI003209F2AE
MMRRKTISWIVILFIASFFLFGIKYETVLYIGMSSPTLDGYSIDVEVKIDGKLVLNDSINNNPYKYNTLKKELKIGVRRVEISSVKANVHTIKEIFVLPNQFILLEFLPRLRSEGEEPEFFIMNGFKPFRYE